MEGISSLGTQATAITPNVIVNIAANHIHRVILIFVALILCPLSIKGYHIGELS